MSVAGEAGATVTATAAKDKGQPPTANHILALFAPDIKFNLISTCRDTEHCIQSKHLRHQSNILCPHGVDSLLITSFEVGVNDLL